MQIRERPEAYFFLLIPFVISKVRMKNIMSLVKLDVITTSLPVEVPLYIEFSPVKKVWKDSLITKEIIPSSERSTIF